MAVLERFDTVAIAFAYRLWSNSLGDVFPRGLSKFVEWLFCQPIVESAAKLTDRVEQSERQRLSQAVQPLPSQANTLTSLLLPHNMSNHFYLPLLLFSSDYFSNVCQVSSFSVLGKASLQGDRLLHTLFTFIPSPIHFRQFYDRNFGKNHGKIIQFSSFCH